MGYRYYLGTISKKEYKNIKNIKSLEKLKKVYNKEDYLGVYEFVDVIKDVSDLAYKINSRKKRSLFFKNEELNSYYNSDYTLFVINKNDLLNLIDLYREVILNYYKRKFENGNSLNKEFDHRNYQSIMEVIRTKLVEWEGKSCLDLSDDSFRLSNSCTYEYGVFDLVHLYKTFDFKKNKLVVLAY